MNETAKYRLLDLISKNEPVSTLFQWGYSYASIAQWYLELQARGLVQCSEGNLTLTNAGRQRLKRLHDRIGKNSLERLNQYRIPKMSIDTVYLPK